METGIDLSISECHVSGYPVIEHDTALINPDKPYRLTISNPLAWTNGEQFKSRMEEDAYLIDTMISYRELWESFQRGGKGIKSYCDFNNCPFTSPDEEISFEEMASLALIVYHYHGI